MGLGAGGRKEWGMTLDKTGISFWSDESVLKLHRVQLCDYTKRMNFKYENYVSVKTVI